MRRRSWIIVVMLALASCSGDDPSPEAAATTPAVARIPAGYGTLTPIHSVARMPALRALEPEQAILRGPHFAFAVEGTVRTSEPLSADLAGSLNLPEGAVPADGHELFLVVTADRPLLGDHETATTVSNVSYEVVAGDVVRRVAAPVMRRSGDVIAVSLPVGSEPVLRIGDAGRVQTLSLETGRRGKDAIAGYYPMRDAQWRQAAGGGEPTGLILSGGPLAGKPQGARLASVGLRDAEGELRPWLPKRGWAKPGRAWLTLRPEVVYWRPGSDDDDVTIPKSAFTLTGPDGAPIPLSGSSSMSPGAQTDQPVGQSDTSLFVADVPAGFTRGTLSFRFTGTIRVEDAPVSWTAYSGLVDTGTVTVE
jgi:hypothetical protein